MIRENTQLNGLSKKNQDGGCIYLFIYTYKVIRMKNTGISLFVLYHPEAEQQRIQIMDHLIIFLIRSLKKQKQSHVF